MRQGKPWFKSRLHISGNRHWLAKAYIKSLNDIRRHCDGSIKFLNLFFLLCVPLPKKVNYLKIYIYEQHFLTVSKNCFVRVISENTWRTTYPFGTEITLLMLEHRKTHFSNFISRVLHRWKMKTVPVPWPSSRLRRHVVHTPRQ